MIGGVEASGSAPPGRVTFERRSCPSEVDVTRSTGPRVLMVACFYPPDTGGLAHQTRLLTRELARTGTRVEVVTPRLPGTPATELDGGARVYRLFAITDGQKYRRRFFSWLPSLAWHLIRRRAEYDVLHIHQAMYHAAAAVLIGRLLGKVTIVKAAGGGSSGNVAALERWAFGHWTLRQIAKADCVITLSDEISSELRRHGVSQEQMRFVPNGVELDGAPAPVQGLKAGPTVLVAGRLSDEKGLDDLLHAWPAVRERVPDAQLVLLGDGPMEHELRQLARTLGVEESVAFGGNVPSDVVRAHLAAVQVFALPSRHEGMSNSLLEGMAAGRACLVSDTPANAAMVRHGVDALTFRTADPADLAAKLSELLSDARLRERLGAAARAVIVERYSIAATAEKYRALYVELLARAGR